MKAILCGLVMGLFLKVPSWAESSIVRIDIGQEVGMPSDTVKVPIMINTSISLSGIALTLFYESSDIEYLSSEQVVFPFEVFESVKNGLVSYVFLNPNTNAALASGNQQLVVMKFKIGPTAQMGEIHIEGENFSLTDGQLSVDERDGEIVSGKIIVTQQAIRLSQTAWLSQDVLRLGIALENTQPVSAIQAVLRWSNPQVVFQDIHPTQRTSAWQVFAQPRTGALSVIVADLSGKNSIVSGQGDILELDLTYLGGGELFEEIEVDSLIVTDNGGEIIPVVPYSLILKNDGREVVFEEDGSSGEDGQGQESDPVSDEGVNEEPDDTPVSDDVESDDSPVGEEDEMETSTPIPNVEPARDPNELQVKIVEVLADPPSGLDGDINGDGVRDSRQDEFVEIRNMGQGPVNLSGWRLSDDDVALEAMFQFDEGVQISAGERIVVFGGGVNVSVLGQVYIDDGSIGNGLTNGGDTLVLINALGDTIDIVSFGSEGGKNQSLNRVGDRFELHGEGNGRTMFSPNKPRPVIDLAFPLPANRELLSGQISGMGAYVLYTDKIDQPIPKEDVFWVSSDSLIVSIQPDGSFVTKRPGVVDVWFAWKGIESLHTSITVVSSVDESHLVPAQDMDGLVVSEIHANPGDGESGDTNGDGIRDGYQDEFVEILNISDKEIDLSKWHLGDDTKLAGLFQFPPKTRLLPRQYLTLFGGGRVENISGVTYVDDGRIGDGLSNSGDVIKLISPNGEYTALEVSFASSQKGVSLKRTPGGDYVPHDVFPNKGRRSPGYAGVDLTGLYIQAEHIVGHVNDSLQLMAMGVFGDGDVLPVTHQVNWEADPFNALLDKGLVSLGYEGECHVSVWFGEIKSGSVRVGFRGKNLKVDTTDSVSASEMESQKNSEYIRKSLVLTEIHANPGIGVLGDTNGNGKRETYGDEFLEFYNSGSDTLDLSFYRITDDSIEVVSFFEFPSKTLLLPQAFLVVWGEKELLEQGQLSAMGRIGDGLSNGGEQICLLVPNDSTCVRTWKYDGSYSGDSWLNDGREGWIRHSDSPVVERFSPGRPPNVLTYLQTEINDKQLKVGEKTHLSVNGMLSDGTQKDFTQSVIWEIGSGIVKIEGDTLSAHAVGQTDIRPVWGDVSGEALDVWVVMPHHDVPDSVETDRMNEGERHRPPSQTEGDVSEGIEGELLNHAPVFITRADSTTLVGLKYVYDPVVSDPEGDSVWVWVLEKPAWLQSYNGRFEGYAPGAEQDAAIFSLLVTDGQDTTFQIVEIEILDLSLMGKEFSELTLLEGSEFQMDWPFSEQYDTQLDGDWEWEINKDKVILKPLKTGLQLLELGVSFQGESIYKTWTIDIQPRSQVIPTQIKFETQVDSLTLVEIQGEEKVKPLSPRPNPFHSQIQFDFYSVGGPVLVTVYSILGQPVRQIVNDVLPVGYYSRFWDGTDNLGNNLSTGIYLIHLNVEFATYTYRVALLR